MYLQAFGEIIVDALTVNPALADISSASAILDASNYTFQAITLGKDGAGFKYHAHTVSSLDAGVYNDGKVLVVNYEDSNPSSYNAHITALELSSTYRSIPTAPTIYDTRLEASSTKTNVSSTEPDLGHYWNPILHEDYSGAWNVIGYPPSGNSEEYYVYSSNGSFLTSGNLSGYFNTNELVDVSGFIKIADAAAVAVPAAGMFSDGAVLVSALALTPGAVQINIVIQKGDAVALACYGGVSQIGVYCLDMKAMLGNGLSPPYEWDALNSNRIYKLVAKITLLDNLLFNNDYDFQSLGMILFSGLKGFEDSLVDLGTLGGPSIGLEFDFV